MNGGVLFILFVIINSPLLRFLPGREPVILQIKKAHNICLVLQLKICEQCVYYACLNEMVSIM